MDQFEPNLGTSFRIRGVNSMDEAIELATILRSGALPAEINQIQSQVVGPELGAAAVQAGQLAAVLAVIAVLVYMGVSYGLFGLFANLALVVNLSLITGSCPCWAYPIPTWDRRHCFDHRYGGGCQCAGV